jgi:predicted acetyltransferase
MTHDVKVATREKLADILSAVESVFGDEISDDEVERYANTIDIDRVIYIEDGDDVVAGAGAYTFRSSVPGGLLPTGGVTLVGVKPSHRRRGLLRAMMRQQLDDIRQRGEPIATLWASEGAIYGRFGYGLASVQAWVDVERDKVRFVDDPGPSGRVRMLPLEVAQDSVAAVYERVQARTPGMFERTDAWWQWRLLRDPKEWRDGASQKFVALWEDGSGAPRGYAIYRIETGWSHAGPTGSVQMQELIADEVDSLREMWRFILSIDLVSKAKGRYALLPIDSPLWTILDEPRRLQATLTDALWLRVVDVKAALEGRAYEGSGRISFELRDDFCEWNSGTWSLTVSEGRGSLEKTDRSADLALDASTLANIYLGTFTFAQMKRAGRVTGDIATADNLFRTDVAPYCPEIF